tara:strand:- start:771 stop:1037 length:267 start_codon:yes stop_codon:yes gene_type:complete
MDETETEVKKKGYYTANVKKAIYKYREKNREQYNKYQRERTAWRIINEPGYAEAMEAKADARRHANRKATKLKKIRVTELVSPFGWNG